MSISDLQCPISREVFMNPLLCSDGFSYEESYITKWIGRYKRSPMIGSELSDCRLRENKSLSFFLNTFNGLKRRLNVDRLPAKKSEEQALPAELKLRFDKVLDNYYKSTLELEKCCELMAEIYDMAPKNFDAAINYANILRFSTKFDKALSIIKTLEDIRPDTFIPKYMKIRVLAESGERKKAAKCLTKVVQRYRIEDHLLVDLRFMSYSLLSTSNRDYAFKISATYLRVVPGDMRALTHFIYINLLRENYDYVIQASDGYLKGNPDDVSVLFHQAKAYNRKGNKKKAVELYTKIADFSVDKSVKAKALYESAVNRDNEKEFDTIIAELENSYALDAREEADGYLAALYADKKMYEEAEKWIKNCAKRVNIMDDNVYLGIKVLIEEHKGLYDEAIKGYIRLAELDCANSTYYNNRIDLLLQKVAIANQS